MGPTKSKCPQLCPKLARELSKAKVLLQTQTLQVQCTSSGKTAVWCQRAWDDHTCHRATQTVTAQA